MPVCRYAMARHRVAFLVARLGLIGYYLHTHYRKGLLNKTLSFLMETIDKTDSLDTIDNGDASSRFAMEGVQRVCYEISMM